ncbi:DUF1330 domain-containing protein [Ideonella sp. DXS29W]|uniref:DUF1330 domain-containing protein n=1 Tax=Ideonella lacteola TaxID=2984193 RepID=A0ABU9BRJ2_9BURK
MTAAYIVFIKEKTSDAVELGRYSAQVGRSFDGREVRFHVTYGRQQVLEGAPAEGVVVLEFPSWAEAEDWYRSPAYQSAARHRFAGADYRAILVEGRPASGEASPPVSTSDAAERRG